MGVWSEKRSGREPLGSQRQHIKIGHPSVLVERRKSKRTDIPPPPQTYMYMGTLLSEILLYLLEGCYGFLAISRVLQSTGITRWRIYTINSAISIP